MVKLNLYLAGQSRNSMIAMKNLQAAVAQLPEHTVELTVIDVLEFPLRALDEGVLVTPTLIRRDPQPLRILIGTLDDGNEMMALLDLKQVPR